MIIKILIGIQASGKSTYSKKFVEDNKNWIILSRDSITYSLFNKFKNDYKSMLLVNKISNDMIKNALDTNYNVIIDNTNLKQKDIKGIINNFNHLADIEFELFPIDLETALERNENRIHKVPTDVIIEAKRIYDILITQFEFKTLKKI